MSKEAMKLALEALEVDPFEMVEDADGHMVFLTNQAITALREALAEKPAQRKYCRGDRLICLETEEYCVIHISGTDRQWVKFPDTHIGVYKNEQLAELFELLPKEIEIEQPAQQDSTCSNALRIQGKAYPRTCKKCGLGPCVELAQQALDKMAENARELGLDYEPAQQEPWPEDPAGHKAGGVQLSGTSKSKAITELYALFGAPHNADINLTGLNMLLDALIASPPAQRTWVGLTDVEWMNIVNKDQAWFGQRPDEVAHEVAKLVEAKLKEKNR